MTIKAFKQSVSPIKFSIYLTVSLLTTLLLTIAMSSKAIVIRHDVDANKYKATAADFPPLVTLYSIGVHGTLVHPEWVVTAAHAVFCMTPGQKLRVGNELRSVEGQYSHPDYILGEEHDIALVKLSQPVDSIKPAKLFYAKTEVGKETWFIGAGGTGTGDKGETISNIENEGQLRKAQNKIVSVTDADIVFKFEKGDEGLPLEGVSGNGDSGGPAFIKNGDDYQLLGISSRTGSVDYGAGEYGVIELYTRISSYTAWIEQVISAENEQERRRISTKNRFLQEGMNSDNIDEICRSIEVN